MRLPRFLRRSSSPQSAVVFTRVDAAAEETPHESPSALRLRRWESARTHRLNQHQWKYATGQSVNIDLVDRLETIRTRCEYEVANNPIVEGVIETYAADVVGRNGPELQIQSSVAEFNDTVEHEWRSFFAMPDVNRRLGGAEFVRLCIRQLWLCGDYLAQITSVDRPGPVKLGVRPVHPRRLETPLNRLGDKNVILGVEMDSNGTPIVYHLRREESSSTVLTVVHDPVDAAEIIHQYKMCEPDQIRGVPWLAPCLDVIANLRDFDGHVLEAAKNAAAQGVIWSTNHPDADYKEVSGTITFEAGTESTGPPGWQPMMVNPTQPTSTYQEFRHERLREIGRPVNMPLMMVLLSSADSNFSSAHYDGQIYTRGVQCTQSWLARTLLGRLLNEVVAELTPLLVANGVEVPGDWVPEWTWNVPPYVNPKQMYDSMRARLEDGTIPYSDLLAAYNLSFDAVVAKRKRENEQLEVAGLPPLPINTGSGSQGSEDPDSEEPGTKKGTGKDAAKPVKNGR